MNENVIIINKPNDNSIPDKILGLPDKQAKMYFKKLSEGRQVVRIELDAGFDWTESVKPHLPNCPDWCPATHFGYLESGEMGIKMTDGTETVIKAGDTYLVPPGHLPIINKKSVMIEFSQDTTYTNKDFIENK